MRDNADLKFSGAERRACVVWVDFTPVSIKHVPHLLQIHGRTCLTTLLKRLRSYFGANFDYYIVCFNDHIRNQIMTEVSSSEVQVFCSSSTTTDAALKNIWAIHPDLRTAVFFSANAVLSDCELADRMLALHHSAGADICLSKNVPPGVGPMLIVSRSTADIIGRKCGNSHTLQGLAASLAVVAATSHDDQLRIVTYSPETEQYLIPECLPVSALVEDEQSRLSAELALDKHPDRYDAQLAYAFKQARLTISQHPRPIRRNIKPCDAPQTVLFTSPRVAFSGGDESFFSLITNLNRWKFRPVAVFPFETILAEKLEQQGVSIEIAGWDYSSCVLTNLNYCEYLLNSYRPAIVHLDMSPSPALMVTAYTRRIKIVGHLRSFVGSILPAEAYLAERIITVSEAVARDLRRSNIDPKAVVRIYNGVKADQLNVSDVEIANSRRQRDIPDDARIICMVARIEETKRLDLLIKALPKIISAVPTAHVIFVGEYSARDLEYYCRLQAMIENSGLERRVIWWGFERRMGLVYRISDVLVHCKRQEPLARCMIEALPMALPIVGPNDGGSPEIIRDGHNGLLYEPDGADGLAAAVIQILTNDGLRAQMAQAALETFQEFTIERHVQSVEALYNELLAEN